MQLQRAESKSRKYLRAPSFCPLVLTQIAMPTKGVEMFESQWLKKAQKDLHLNYHMTQ